MSRIEVLGCPVDNVTMSQAVRTIEGFIESEAPHQIVPINAAKLWRMERDARLDGIVRRASLIVAEKAIVLASLVLGSPLKAHIGGVMLLKEFLPVAAEKGYALYLVGATPRVVADAVANIRRQFPGINLVGWHDGYFDRDGESKLIGEINQMRPQVLLVAMGTPKQEYWIAEHLADLGVPVCLGVGGSFDVLAGIKRDAPSWVRVLAVEWLYRLVQDPRNLWRRYLITIPWFILRVGVARAQLGVFTPRASQR